MARDAVGKVVNLSAEGLLIKALAGMVPIGTHLVDVRNQPVGRVIDVLGPVKAPYLLVQPPRGGKGGPRLDREVYLP